MDSLDKGMGGEGSDDNNSGLTELELEDVTSVFKSLETGIRSGTIMAKDLTKALKMLGVNPLEQEIMDITNEIARNGFIHFSSFCTAVHRKYREENEEIFQQNMFKVLCGTKPFSDKYKARKYKVQEQFLTRVDFDFIMRNLPVKVCDQDIEEMFSAADTDQDGRISWSEFQAMARLPDTGGVWASSPASSSSAPAPPLTLSVCELARRAPRDISETHIMAGWEKIGLVRPQASVPTINMHRRVVFQD